MPWGIPGLETVTGRKQPIAGGPADPDLRPASGEGLVRLQEELGRRIPTLWRPERAPLALGGCFVAFPRGLSGPGAQGDPANAAAVVVSDGRLIASMLVTGRAEWSYERGLLFLREGPLLESAIRSLPQKPDVLLVNGTGRDHPRRAGLAVHLGALLELPTVGVTHRSLCAQGPWPEDKEGSVSPLLLEGEVVGYWLRTRSGARPLAVHAAWRTSPEVAVEVVIAAIRQARTPEPLRLARQLARTARASG